MQGRGWLKPAVEFGADGVESPVSGEQQLARPRQQGSVGDDEIPTDLMGDYLSAMYSTVMCCLWAATYFAPSCVFSCSRLLQREQRRWTTDERLQAVEARENRLIRREQRFLVSQPSVVKRASMCLLRKQPVS